MGPNSGARLSRIQILAWSHIAKSLGILLSSWSLSLVSPEMRRAIPPSSQCCYEEPVS